MLPTFSREISCPQQLPTISLACFVASKLRRTLHSHLLCVLFHADNWKICAATRQDGCANQPPLGPDEDDPQCKNQLPWACCTTGKNIPKDDRSQCTLNTCDAGTLGSDSNYCTDTSCLTYTLPYSETDFTFYVADDRFVSELPWDPKPCGGEGASGLCSDKSKVSSPAHSRACFLLSGAMLTSYLCSAAMLLSVGSTSSL